MTNRKTKAVVLSIILLGISIGLGIFLLQGRAAEDGIFASSTASSTGCRSTKVRELPKGTDTVVMSGITEQYSLETLSEQSTLVLYGTVSSIQEPILVKSAFGAVSVYTDVEITPKEIYRGEAKEKVTLRLPGGLMNGEYYDYPDIPELEINGDYLFYLYHSSKGCGVYTKGDEYYLTGMGQSVFFPTKAAENLLFYNNARSSKEKATKVTDQPMKSAASDAVLSQSKLEALYLDFNQSHPVDEEYFAKESQEAYEANLKSGFMTQEEYETYIAAIDQYATEITVEELRELEQENEAQKEELRRHRDSAG